MRKKENSYKLVLFLVACIIVLLNSIEIILKCNNGDSIVFNTVGKFWNEGKIPYIDLFDHKGPIIHFVNMLGWKFFHCEQGILFFQIIFLFFTSVFLFKIAKLEIHSDRKSLLFTILTICFLGFTYQGGNMTEEFCLPLITLSLYFNLKFLKEYVENQTKEHCKKYAFWYGASFAVCFLTRLTNAVSICVGILVIGVILLKEKKWKNILENVIFFMLGFLVCFLPFAIYFARHDAFYEFLEGTILFNFRYATNSASWLREKRLIKNVIKYLIFYFSSYVILIIGIIKLKRKKNVIGVFYILLGIFETILFLKSRLYVHYVIVCLPNIVLSLLELNKNKNFRKYQNVICILILVGYLLFWVRGQFIRKVHDYNLYDSFIEQIPEEERKSFIAVNVEGRIYEHYNICPYYKYFVLQDFQASNSEKLYDEMHDVFYKGDVKWILFEGDIEESLIKDVVEKRYLIIDEKEDVILYKLNG